MYQKRNNILEIIVLYTKNYRRQLYLREISKLSKLPLKTTQTALADLEAGSIIKSLVRGKNKYFSLNLENIQTKMYLLYSEVYKTSVFLDKYLQFKTFLKALPSNNFIAIFGSFAKFSANKDSDADLLIISEKELELPTHLLSNKIHSLYMPENAFKESVQKQEALIKEIEENHIILNNHSFYVNLMWEFYESR
jgi:predicted nucleotidyltransferase